VVGRIERWHGRRAARPEQEILPAPEDSGGATLRGRIKNVICDRGYGFIAAEDGRDYFFHINALEPGLEFDQLQPDLTVSFEVKSGPMRGRAGAARLVRRDLAADEAAPAPHSAESDGEALQGPPTLGASGEAGEPEPPLADSAAGPAPTEMEESRS
jgi:cold shock CspA family protein